MRITPFTDDISAYLKEDDVIDFNKSIITHLADKLYKISDSEISYIKYVYEFVRDNISHSADINEDVITCSASEALTARHGICFAKSHLLAALLRSSNAKVKATLKKKLISNIKKTAIFKR